MEELVWLWFRPIGVVGMVFEHGDEWMPPALPYRPEADRGSWGLPGPTRGIPMPHAP